MKTKQLFDVEKIQYVKWYHYLYLWLFGTYRTIDPSEQPTREIRYKKVRNNIYVLSDKELT